MIYVIVYRLEIWSIAINALIMHDLVYGKSIFPLKSSDNELRILTCLNKMYHYIFMHLLCLVTFYILFHFI